MQGIVYRLCHGSRGAHIVLFSVQDSLAVRPKLYIGVVGRDAGGHKKIN